MRPRTARTGVKGKPNGQGTRERILKVALQEFAEKGFSGARVVRIAVSASTSKHMLYYHFRSKTGLYESVLEQAYGGIRFTEADIDVDHMDPVEALKSIVRQSFDYHCNNEMFVRLVMNENIHHAKHITDDRILGNRPIIERLATIIERGAIAGTLRSDIDPRQLHMTISALGFHYVSNKYSFAKIFEMDMSSSAARLQRRELVVDIVVRWCSAGGGASF